MGLKINLKRGEKLFIPGGSLQCGDEKVVIFLEGDIPLLRERDVLTAETADTPAKRLVLALQKIYLSKQADELHELYRLFMRDVLRDLPDCATYVADIDSFVSEGDHFKALREARALVEFEASLKLAPETPGPDGKKRVLQAVATSSAVL